VLQARSSALRRKDLHKVNDMPDPNMVFYHTDDSLVTAINPITFGSLTEKGNISSTFTVWVWNDRNAVLGSDTAVSPKISSLHGVDDVSIIFDGTIINSYLSMLEARTCGAINVAADLLTTWVPIRPDSFLTLGNMPSNTGREIELRLNVPQDANVLSLASFTLSISV
jgi:hypothetical protein